ncbi:MAG: hypothetical protein AAGI37_15365 [Planctomycetota bacterium]
MQTQSTKQRAVTDLRFAALLLIGLLLLLLFGGLTGCGAARPIPESAPVAVDATAEIEGSARLIAEGDLEAARGRLGEVADLPLSYHQARQVRSLFLLIDGAEALMNGDVAAARSAWSRIEDPRLQREVRLRAADAGIDVPLIPSVDAPTSSSRPEPHLSQTPIEEVG